MRMMVDYAADCDTHMREADEREEEEDARARARPGGFPRSPSPSRCFPVFACAADKPVPGAPKRKKTRARRHSAKDGYRYHAAKHAKIPPSARASPTSPTKQFAVFTHSPGKSAPGAPERKLREERKRRRRRRRPVTDDELEPGEIRDHDFTETTPFDGAVASTNDRAR